MSYCVYKHTFPNGKVYIGITCRKPEHRWNNGKGYLEKKNDEYIQPSIARAINKYGWENVEHEILYNGLNKEEAETLEVKLIDEYKSNQPNFGYNLAIGGGVPNKERSIPVRCVETGVIYENANEASKEVNVHASYILKVCNGKRGSAGKLHWRFADEEELDCYKKYTAKHTFICVDCGCSFTSQNKRTRCSECERKHKAKLMRERKVKNTK